MCRKVLWLQAFLCECLFEYIHIGQNRDRLSACKDSIIYILKAVAGYDRYNHSIRRNQSLFTGFFETCRTGCSGRLAKHAARASQKAHRIEDFLVGYIDRDTVGFTNRIKCFIGISRNADGYRVKDGRVLELAFPVSTNQSIPAEQSLFEQLQATSKLAGFKVNLRPLDLSSWYGALGKNDYSLVSAPYTKVGPDVLRTLFASAGTVPAPSGYFANHAQVKDAALDALLTEASQVSDPAKRASLYEQAQKLVLGGFYILPLYDQQNHFLFSSTVKGLRAMPTVSTPTLYDTWLDR